MTDKWDILLPQLLDDINELPLDYKHKVRVRCGCGKVTEISTRALYRRWAKAGRAYCCKSCSVKAYANSPDRVAKFKRSFAESVTDEHRARCAQAGRKPWADAEYKQKMSDLLAKRNQHDSRLVGGRKKGLRSFLRTNYKAHLARIRSQQRGRASVIEDVFAGILRDLDIAFTRQHKIGYYVYDFFLPKHNMLVEVNGDYWHKDTTSQDAAKTTSACNRGYNVKVVWEHEFGELGKVESLVRYWCGLDQYTQADFEFKELVVGEVDSKAARMFYGKYHYLPSTSKFGTHIGCCLDELLIACATFSSVTRKEVATRLRLRPRQVRELGRFCIHPCYHKPNFGSWFLSRATKLFAAQCDGVKAVVSFADTTLHDGALYKATNWVLDGQTAPNYMYRSRDGYLMHKKTLWDHACKMGLKEDEYATKYGYIKVWSKPKNRFVLYLGDN